MLPVLAENKSLNLTRLVGLSSKLRLKKTSSSLLKLGAMRLKTRSRKNFILRNMGVFLLSKYNYFTGIANTKLLKSQFKKKYFSFLYPNQVKKSILFRKKKIVISRFFRKLRARLSLSSSPFFTTKYLLFHLRDHFNTRLTSKNVNGYQNFHRNILTTNRLYYKGNDLSARSEEVFIPRIRFKPGYQRL